MYVNDPPGSRCQANLAAANRAAQSMNVDVEVVKKTSAEYSLLENPPPCPSIALDGHLIVQNGTMSFDELKKAIVQQKKNFEEDHAMDFSMPVTMVYSACSEASCRDFSDSAERSL